MGIPFNYVPNDARASKVYIELFGVQRSLGSFFIPPTGLIIGMYDPTKTSTVNYVPIKLTDSDDAGLKAGFGSHTHRQALALPPAVFNQGGGVWWVPVPEAGAGVAATEDVTFTGAATSSGTLPFLIGGERITVGVASGDAVGDIATALVDAITAEQNLAVTAVAALGVVTVTAKFKGTQGNQILIKLNPAGDADSALNPSGVTTTLSSVDGYLASGATDPDLEDVFFTSGEDKLGDRWYTGLTCPFVDATSLGYYKASGDARFDPAVNRFFACYPAYTKETYAQALALPATINSRWVAPIWDNRYLAPAFELGAELFGIILDEQNQAPNRPYKTISLNGSVDSTVDNLSTPKYDALFKAGMSYCKIGTDNVMRIGDIALSYRTNDAGGKTTEWYEAVQLHLRQAKSYSLEQVFLTADYARGVVKSDLDVGGGVNFDVAPKDVVSSIAKLIDDLWGFYVWTKNVKTVKKSIAAEINGSNNGRIDSALTDDSAEALRIIAVSYKYYY